MEPNEAAPPSNPGANVVDTAVGVQLTANVTTGAPGPQVRRTKRALIALTSIVLLLAIAALLTFWRLSNESTVNISPAQSTATAQAVATNAAYSATSTALANARATASANATSTVTALNTILSQAHVVYRAPVPGPGCDSSGADWGETSGEVKCLSDGVQLTSGSTLQSIASVSLLQLPTGGFPRHYLLNVTLSILGTGTTANVQAEGDSAFVTVDVTKDQFSIYGPNAKLVVAGNLDGTGKSKVGILSLGGQTLFLINNSVFGAYEGSFSAVSSFDLSVFPGNGSPGGQAEFSDFTLSALS